MKLGARNHTVQQNVRARKLRSEMSVSEKVLWEQLRRRKLGYSFHRQVPAGPYILDFYCARASLCIEVDGEQHLETRWKGPPTRLGKYIENFCFGHHFAKPGCMLEWWW